MKLSCQEGLVPGSRFADKLAYLEAHGVQGVELNGSALTDAAGFTERQAALKDSPVKASSICGGHPAELAHPDPRRRRAAKDGLKQQLQYAAELGAVGAITVPIFNGPDRVPDLSPFMTAAQAERALIVAVLKELAPFAEEVGAAILVEPLNRYESNALPTQEYGAAVVREVNSPGVRLMSDLFHMHIEERNPAASLRACGDVIAHVHLADSTRLEPGTGTTDFACAFAALREVGFQGFMAYECGLSGPANEVLPVSFARMRELLAG